MTAGLGRKQKSADFSIPFEAKYVFTSPVLHFPGLP